MFSLFLPEQCLHCKQPSAYAHNHKLNDRLSHYLCEVCLRILNNQEVPEEGKVRNEFEHLGTRVEFSHCQAGYTFVVGSPLQSLIHAMKYDGMIRLAGHLGKSMLSLVPKAVSVIVPVPLHRTRLAERGYNQAEVIAREMTVQSRMKVIGAIRRTRPTPSQTNLPLPKRIENVRGAFALTRDAEEIKGKNILVVDDVMTTGSTLASVAETLMASWPKSISILALAIAEHTG